MLRFANDHAHLQHVIDVSVAEQCANVTFVQLSEKIAPTESCSCLSFIPALDGSFSALLVL
jgi:hypothetical protein